MAIAETGNRIVDGQARRGKAARDAEDRKSARSKSRGAKSKASRSRTNSKARAGRVAGKSKRGRGIAGQVHRSRAGARKTISYALDKPDARLISSNSGLTAKQIADSFKLATDGRSDINKNTGHISFSLPIGEKLSDAKWDQVIDVARHELGLDDGFPFACGLHADTDHQHVHLVYSRVSYDGRVFDDRFLKVRMATVEDLIEDKFGLKLIPKPPVPTAPLYTKNEAELAARTGMKPPRFVMFDAITKAKKDKPDVMTFVERLKAQGVTARPAIRNSKMSGFSFSYQGVELGASKIHNSLGWANLQKGIRYDSNEDDPKLAKHAASITPRGEVEQLKPNTTDREVHGISEEMERSASGFKTPEPSQWLFC